VQLVDLLLPGLQVVDAFLRSRCFNGCDLLLELLINFNQRAEIFTKLKIAFFDAGKPRCKILKMTDNFLDKL
jgi:hypothetical protein